MGAGAVSDPISHHRLRGVEPELRDYPSAQDFPKYREKYGPRSVLRCWATDKDDATTDPRFGKVGRQKLEDSRPLTRKRMETVDEEFEAAATDFIKRQHVAGKPFLSHCERGGTLPVHIQVFSSAAESGNLLHRPGI